MIIDLNTGFRGIIYAIDLAHLELLLQSKSDENNRIIVQPDEWKGDNFDLWLRNGTLIFAKGMKSSGLPLLMKAEVAPSEEDGITLYIVSKEIE